VILAAVVLSMLENVARKWSDRIDDAFGLAAVRLRAHLRCRRACEAPVRILVLLYRYLPRRRPGWRAALLGGALPRSGSRGCRSASAGTSPPADYPDLRPAAPIFVFLFSVNERHGVRHCAILNGRGRRCPGGESVAGAR